MFLRGNGRRLAAGGRGEVAGMLLEGWAEQGAKKQSDGDALAFPGRPSPSARIQTLKALSPGGAGRGEPCRGRPDTAGRKESSTEKRDSSGAGRGASLQKLLEAQKIKKGQDHR